MNPFVDRSLPPPLHYGIEQQFAATYFKDPRQITVRLQKIVFEIHKKTTPNSYSPYAYFCHRFNSSATVNDTPSLNPPLEYVAHRMMNPRICNLSAMSKSSDTFDSDQIFSTESTGSTKVASWMAFQRRNALCPTKGATSPFAQAGEGSWIRSLAKGYHVRRESAHLWRYTCLSSW